MGDKKLEIIIYVDVLLAINFIVDYLLLLCLNKLTGRRSKTYRICLAASVGALSSLVIFLPQMNLISQLLFKLLVSATMILALNKPLCIKQYLKEFGLFYLVTMFFGGIVFGIYTTITPQNMVVANGTMYFYIPSLLLIGCIGVSYLAVVIFKNILERSLLTCGEYSVTVSVFGKKQNFKGFVDTGNFLKDPFSDTPVVVCSISDAGSIIPKELKHIIEKEEALDSEKILNLDDKTRKQLRLIPFNTVNTTGIMPALRADFIEVLSDNKLFMYPNVYLAISKDKIGGGDYNLLLSPQLMKLSYSKNNLNIN